MKEMFYGEAINFAISEKMYLHDNIYILGQGVDDSSSAVGPLKDLKKKFPKRIQDVPMAEESIAGICVGMAMNGLRPINFHIRMDFLLPMTALSLSLVFGALLIFHRKKADFWLYNQRKEVIIETG